MRKILAITILFFAVLGSDILTFSQAAVTSNINLQPTKNINNLVPTADGDLDTTYDNDGFTTHSYERSPSFSSFEGTSVAVQTDGKIVAAFDGQGFNRVNGDAFIALRYNPDGTPDTSFDGDGRVATDLGNFEGVGQVLSQPDGKVIVIGSRYAGQTSNDFAIVRYNTNGSLDNSFDGNGVAATNFIGVSNDFGSAAVLQPDGKIIVAGRTDRNTNYANNDIGVVRYNPDGSLDTSFGGIGFLSYAFSDNNEAAVAVALQNDGKILLTGTTGTATTADVYVLRLNSDGSPDTTFSGGAVIFSLSAINENAKSIIVQPDGKILVGGFADTGTIEFAVVRLLPDGGFDASFDGDGKVFTSFPPNQGAGISSLVLQSNGKIVAVGTSSGKFAIARYNPDGSLDTGFSGDGRVTTFDSQRAADSTALQADGKLIVGGTLLGSSVFNQAITARYLLSTTSRKTKFDFDGDGKSDVSVFRPSNGTWYLQQSQSGFASVFFGASNDRITPADFDGDGKTDVAVFRPENGVWYLQRSQQGFTSVQFGAQGDMPVPADFDGDGKADIAVFRPSNGTWYILGSSTGFSAVYFGAQGDVPTMGDYDGDGKSDVAVYRPSNGTWYLQRSTAGLTIQQFGVNGDLPVTGDFDGDGKSDLTVFRPANGGWYSLQSTAGFNAVSFGANGDKPVAADYDGDGKTDVAVYRPGNGSWYLQRSQAGFTVFTFGVSEDLPVPAAFIP